MSEEAKSELPDPKDEDPEEDDDNYLILKKLYENDIGDVTVKTLDKFEKKMIAFILTDKSPVFKTMLSIDMLEKKEKVITIEDFDDFIVDQFFKHLYYNGDLEPAELTIPQRFQMYSIYEKYGIDYMVLYMKNELKIHCDEGNMMEYLAECNKYPMLTTEIFNVCVDLLTKKYLRIFKHNSLFVAGCYDSVFPGVGGKPSNHNFRFCCQHHNTELQVPYYSTKVDRDVKTDQEKLPPCTRADVDGDIVRTTRYNTAFCCQHRDLLPEKDKYKALIDKDLEAQKKYLREQYDIYLTLPKNITDRIQEKLFLIS